MSSTVAAPSQRSSSQGNSLEGKSALRPKMFLFAFIGLMLLYVLYNNESFLVHPKDPIWLHYQSFKWWLLPHGIAGACALLLGPMQFSDRLRQRFTKLHRVMGRIYVGGVFLASPLGFYIEFSQERLGAPRSLSLAAGTQAALWILTTGIALAFILQGKIQQHRQWMTRSFAVALVFLEVRVILDVTGWGNLPTVVATTVWACNAFAIPLADIVLQWHDFRRRPVSAKRSAAIA